MRRVLVAGAGVAARRMRARAARARRLARRRRAAGARPPSSCTARRPSRRRSAAHPRAAHRPPTQLADDLGIQLHRDSARLGRHRVTSRPHARRRLRRRTTSSSSRPAPARARPCPARVTFRGPDAAPASSSRPSAASPPTRRCASPSPHRPACGGCCRSTSSRCSARPTLRDRGVAEPGHRRRDRRARAARGVRPGGERGDPPRARPRGRRAGHERRGRRRRSRARSGSMSGDLAPRRRRRRAARARRPAHSGLPHDDDGFIPVDEHGHVVGCTDVFAAGDVTASPIKHGGLAAQQADAVAEAIAAQRRRDRHARAVPARAARPAAHRRDAALPPRRARSGRRARASPASRSGHAASHGALWWPPGKVAGRYLTPFVATATAPGRTLEDRPAGAGPDGLRPAPPGRRAGRRRRRPRRPRRTRSTTPRRGSDRCRHTRRAPRLLAAARPG